MPASLTALCIDNTIAIFTGVVAIRSVTSYKEQLLRTALASAGIFFGAVLAITLPAGMSWQKSSPASAAAAPAARPSATAG